MSELNIQFASDLHIEKCGKKFVNVLDFIKPVGDILILAGDIGSFYALEQLLNFFYQLTAHFQLIIYIAGNKEYYPLGKKRAEKSPLTAEKEFMKRIKKFPRIIYLNNETVKYKNLCFIGTTLWSANNQRDVEIEKYTSISNSYYHVQHQKAVCFLKAALSYCKNNDLIPFVITHYVPTYSVATYVDHKSDLYYSDLDKLFEIVKIHSWICGHTHVNFQKEINGCKLISNQYEAGKTYNKQKIISIKLS